VPDLHEVVRYRALLSLSAAVVTDMVTRSSDRGHRGGRAGHIGHLAGKPWLVAAFPIARLRYTRAAKRWSLYWRDRNPRFHRYDQLPPSPRVDELLQEADRDPIAIFWG
jgi:Protein of unknown function (DUF3024)